MLTPEDLCFLRCRACSVFDASLATSNRGGGMVWSKRFP
jgi:hypothetical protein